MSLHESKSSEYTWNEIDRLSVERGDYISQLAYMIRDKEILRIIEENIHAPLRAKKIISKRLRLKRILKNSEIIAILRAFRREDLVKFFVKKPQRTLSGVTVIAIMTKPFPCPHGRCAYCPGGVTEGVPQSYTGHEPATMRAIQNQYDPFKQVRARIRQLISIGHDVDKIELIIMGGTFLAMPKDYREAFIKGALEGILNRRIKDLETAKKMIETAPIKNIGIVFETRPDWCFEQHVDEMLRLGGTAVEIGVQALSDDIYKIVDRGHSVEDVIRAFAIARDAGFKITAHMMPNLPGSTPELDFKFFVRLFTDEAFKPDALKIYPTFVIKGTKLYNWWLEKKYAPYPDEVLIELLGRIKSIVPRWVRIKRIQRDIPAKLVEAGFRKNLRQLVQEYMINNGLKCRCIRCREVGHVGIAEEEYIRVQKERYYASGGEEVFIMVRDIKNDALIGFLRLRDLNNPHRKELKGRTAMIRELHIYGRMIPVGQHAKNGTIEWQHRGYGSLLLKEAERIAREYFDSKKIAVISGLGVRPYYYKHGYKPDGPYVSKLLQ